eukprot:scaffold773_cov114-Isochrysis_galbana.AAC.14
MEPHPESLAHSGPVAAPLAIPLQLTEARPARQVRNPPHHTHPEPAGPWLLEPVPQQRRVGHVHFEPDTAGAPGAEQQRGGAQDVPDHVQPILPTAQRPLVLEPPHLLGQRQHICRWNVRRVGYQHVKATRHSGGRGGWFGRRPARKGGDAEWLQHRLVPAAQPQFPRVQPRERDCFRAHVQPDAFGIRKLAEKRQPDGPRAAANVQDAEVTTGRGRRLSRLATARQDQLHQLLGLWPRDENRRRQPERELVEVPVADNVLDRRPAQPLQAHLLERPAHRLRERLAAQPEQARPLAQAGGVSQQVLCRQPSLGHVAGEECLLSCRERRSEARRLGRQSEGPRRRVRQQHAHSEPRDDGHSRGLQLPK